MIIIIIKEKFGGYFVHFFLNASLIKHQVKFKQVFSSCLLVMNLWVTNRIRKNVFFRTMKNNLLWKLHH